VPDALGRLESLSDFL